MFHYPNIHLVEQQAKLIGIPLLEKKTKGEQEKELEDLEALLSEAKRKYDIEGVASGAVASDYQKTRIERVCERVGLKSFAPLWHKDQGQLLRDEVRAGFEIIVVGVYAEGLDEKWLGRRLDDKAVGELAGKKLLSPVGEGGEFETLVTDGPVFKKRLAITEKSRQWDGTRGEVEFSARA
jgi:ABC transporter with metal-binding/Fe-S-binding domain ATP-binding protein